jgi:hypothetical protein
MRPIRFSALLATLTVCSPIKAGVVVETSLNLLRLQISPSSVTLQIISPFTASANTSAEDSITGLNPQQFNQVNDSATSASATTAFASANGAASAVSLTASASSGVNLPEVTSSASSAGQGGLGLDFGGTGLIEIVSPTNTTVSTQFSAQFSGNQSLTTAGGGQLATSEIIFNFMLPDLGANASVFFLDSPLSIGPDSLLISPYSDTLMNSVDLQTNTSYNFLLEVDAESSGLDFVPEPSYSFLTVCSFLAILLAGGILRVRRARKSVSA